MPGPACPEMTSVLGVRSQTLVLTTGVHDTIRLEPRDRFGNTVSTSELDEISARFSVSVFRYDFPAFIAYVTYGINNNNKA